MSLNKIKKLNELKDAVMRLKAEGEKIVFTNGCFDLLHYGHVMYLEKAKAQGDVLIVALNSDASVRKLKGRNRPIVKEADRAGVIAGLESVDYVCIFKEETPQKIIESLRPDILVKGADWKGKNIVGAKFLRTYGGRALTIKLAGGRSTSNIIRKIIETS